MAGKGITGAAEALRTLGAWNGMLYLLHRLLVRVSGGAMQIVRYYLVAQPVPESAAGDPPPSGTTSIVEVREGDELVQTFPRPAEVIARRFRDGAVCLAAIAGRGFAGFIWLASGHYDEDEVHCRYVLVDEARSAWDYDVFVLPEYRLSRVFMRLWEAANRRLAGRGVRWSYSRISAFNPGSIRSHRGLGARRLHSATFLCVGSLQLGFFSLAPFVHLWWPGRTPPVLRLRPPRDNN